MYTHMTSLSQRIQESKMKRIGLKNYRKVYRQYMFNEPEFLEFIDTRNDYGRNEKTYFAQNGGSENGSGNGSKAKKIKYVHDKISYVLNEIKCCNGYDISIRRKNDPSNATCLHIVIDSELKLAYVQNISYYQDCVSVGLERPGGGGKLLRMCIQFLKDNKDRYNVKRIQLKDNSFFLCQRYNKKINFALMHTLLYGDTWYGKYGFRPYDPMNDVEDKELTKFYDSNKKIITMTKTKDTNLYNCLYQILRDQESVNGKELKRKINEYHLKHCDETVDVFFRKFLMNYENACAVFSGFYITFCVDLKVYNLMGQSFYLDI